MSNKWSMGNSLPMYTDPTSCPQGAVPTRRANAPEPSARVHFSFRQVANLWVRIHAKSTLVCKIADTWTIPLSRRRRPSKIPIGISQE